MSRPKFRIKFEKNHPDGVLLITRNVAAAKLQRENMFADVKLSTDLYAAGASSHYKPSNKFYATQREYHGW